MDDMLARRAAAVKENPRTVPNGGARSQAFAAQMRAGTVEWEGKQRSKVEGYASITGRSYEMYDMFGPYREMIATNAFDETLAADPDVAFLVNHRGLTMARTTSRTLELSVDSMGLRSVAYLNPDRQDVRDLMAAIDDKDITEMSFAFMIEAGSWNADYTEFRIDKVTIDRGDVSAVNYGANPYTSIAARSKEILSELEYLPFGAQRAAYERLSAAVADPDEPAEDRDASRGDDTHPNDGADKRASEKTGRSVRLIELMLDA